MKRSLDIALRYGVAVLAVGAALGIKLLLDPLTVQDTPFLLVFGAIIVSSWYGGLGPGLLATTASALATDYFFLYPRGTLTGFSVEGIDVLAFMLEGILGRHFSSFYPEEDVVRGHPEDVLRAALAEGRYVEEGPKVRQDGSRFWASAVITTLRDREGNLKGFSMVVHDTTERKHTDDVLRFLADSGARLSSSLGYRDTLANVARLAVPTLADWCAVDVMVEDGSVERLAVEHSDPEKVALAYER